MTCFVLWLILALSLVLLPCVWPWTHITLSIGFTRISLFVPCLTSCSYLDYWFWICQPELISSFIIIQHMFPKPSLCPDKMLCPQNREAAMLGSVRKNQPGLGSRPTKPHLRVGATSSRGVSSTHDDNATYSSRDYSFDCFEYRNLINTMCMLQTTGDHKRVLFFCCSSNSINFPCQ